MCRLLGWVSREPTTLAELLGEQELAEFAALSAKHGDGWGYAWPGPDGIEVVKAPERADVSEGFRRAAHTVSTDLALVHLRWATLGLPLSPDNTHPFTDGRFALAHNGSIAPPRSVEELVPADLRASLRGTTDSERYFLAVAGALRDHPDDLPGSLTRVADRITASLDYSGINALALDDQQLVALCRFDPVAEAREAEHEYYTMRYRVTDSAVVVASSGWGAGWHTLHNGETLVVDRNTLAVHVVPTEPRVA